MSAPNAEPVIVMDDELLRDLSDLVYPHGRGASEDARIRAGAKLTREELVVRRLVAAWLNEGIRREKVRSEERIVAARAAGCFEMDHEGRLANYERLTTRIHDWARDLGCPPGVVTMDWLEQFVAERQANGADLAQQLDRAQEECARRGDALRRTERERDQARVAVPSLPNVGPVTRDGDRPYLWVDNCNLYADDGILARAEQSNLLGLARVRAARAFLDAEAVDHTHDDEVEPPEIVLDLLKQHVTDDGRITPDLPFLIVAALAEREAGR